MDRRLESTPQGLGIAACWLTMALSALAAEPEPPRAPVGYFALQPGDPAILRAGSTRQVADRLLELPKVAGLTIRARWLWIHPAEGKFDFTFVDEQIERCRRINKPYKLLVMTGNGSAPTWIGGAWHRGAPVPWSPELKQTYGELVAELGKRYAHDPLLVGVHITGPTYPSAEMHPAPGIDAVQGFSNQSMAEAWKASIDAYAAAFPQTACLLSISVRRPANFYLGEVVSYGREKLGERFTAQHNALKAGTQPAAPHHRIIEQLHRSGVRVGFEMVCAAANNANRFGSASVMDGIKIGEAAGGTYFDVYPPDLSHLK
jgi:hypothetical protein